MNKILAPTDFSAAAEKAFRFALALANKDKSEIILYHSYVPVESGFIGTEESRRQYNTQNETEIADRLEVLKKRIAGNQEDVQITKVVGQPPLVDGILDFVSENQIDLIVMGTQGASGLKRTIVGSVAARVIEKSEVPVLLIPDGYEFNELPNEFVFITNYLSTDKQAIKLIPEFAADPGPKISVIHLMNAYNSEADKEDQRRTYDAYADTLKQGFDNSEIRFHLLETASVTETMENLDEEIPYEVMVMVRRKKTALEKFFLKSFTQNMA